jgi:hypothetical protein
MILFALVLWLLLIVALGYSIDLLWVSLAPGRWYRYVQAPGIMVHQLSHVLGCFLAGADVTGIVLYAPEGGRVTHGKPRIPGLGQVLIALAPLVGCPVALYLVTKLTGLPFSVESRLHHDFELSLASFGQVFLDCARLLQEASYGVARELWAHPFSLRRWAFVYFAAVLTMRMAPTKADWKQSLHGIVFLALAFVVLGILRNQAPMDRVYRAVTRLVWNAWEILSFGVAMLLVIAVLSLLAAGIARAARTARSARPQAEE